MCNTSYLNAFFSSSKIKQRLYLIPPSCAFLAECGDCEAARDAAQVQPPWVWVNKVDVVAPKRRRGTGGYLCLCFIIFSLSQANFYQEKFAQLIEAEVDRRLEAESELRIERERQVGLGTHLHPLLNYFNPGQERELLLLEKEQELERLRVQHEREIYLMKKKLSTAAAPTSRPQPPATALINLSIPRYHTVGSGKAGYVEYEVRVESGAGEGWTLFRRYRQFRDLHTQLVNRYGVPIQSLPFPGRKLFGSKTEAVSSERQRELQQYLNSLINVASKIAACPLHKAHTREALTSFATFFQTNNASQSETR